MPLTLCVIARDEAERIGACLASAAPLVDRMLVVDTGSRDATREIARAHGAEVVDFTWCDDFAAARNAGLARVRGGYVLVLDADEVLAPAGVAAIRAAVRRGEIDLGLLPLHDATRLDARPEDVVAGVARRGDPHLLPRLLRRTPDLRYAGAVHESVDAWMRRARRRIETLDAPIVHYGAVPELRRKLGKNERNLRLLLAQVEREPGNPILRAHLAAEWTRAGDGTRALAAAEAAWNTLRAGTAAGVSWDGVLPATIFAQLLIVVGALDTADEVLAIARAQARHPNLEFLSGLCAERRHARRGAGTDALARAAAHYTASLAYAGQLFSSEVIPGASGWHAHARLGTVHLLLGDASGALAAFERALAASPGQREAQLGCLEARIALGDAAGALAECAPLLAGPEPDPWLLAGAAAHALGASADAAAFLGRARALRAGRPFVADHRDLVLLELDEKLAAAPAQATRVFAWPRYDDAGELDTLLRDFGAPLAERAGVELWLRFDPRADGVESDAQRALEESYTRQLPAGASLRVCLFDALDDAHGRAATRDLALELPSASRDPARAAFLASLGAPRATSGESLRALLADTR